MYDHSISCGEFVTFQEKPYKTIETYVNLNGNSFFIQIIM